MGRGERARAWAAAAVIAVAAVAFTPLGDWAMLAFSPAIDLVHAPVRWAQRVSFWFSSKKALIERLQMLEAQHAQDEARRQELIAVKTELAQLRALFGVARSFEAQWRAVRVVGVSPDAYGQRVLIEAPQAAVGDIVVAADGLVGIVDRVLGSRAIVRTILDASVAVPAVDRTGKRALLVRGRGDRLHVAFALAEWPLKAGDVLYTSGAGGKFPPGLPLARIVRVAHKPGDLFLTVEAAPAAHWRTRAYLALVPRARR